jgi:hydroxymethylpyrimidine/phosphomethylpyrimidine kinase
MRHDDPRENRPVTVPPPAVLCFSGHDPSGGAGIQADIESLRAVGCHPMTVVTALTEQDTVDVVALHPQRPADLRAQARRIVADVPVGAIKIGLLGSAEIARAVADMARALPGCPVVLDPILAAGGGKVLARGRLVQVLREELLPLATVLTPNSMEARRLAGGCEDLDECALELRRMGSRHVLITGAHEAGDGVVNRLYGEAAVRTWTWPRLPGVYHGSGCTLASALAGFLALGLPVEEAADRAQRTTYDALKSAYALGRGQYLPNRWAARHTDYAAEPNPSCCPRSGA